MDTEFHYYMTGIIAHASGFSKDDAKTIATASEYTDENDEILKVQDRHNGNVYENYISQTMDILKPKQRLMRIYPVFHFIPGEPDADTARRRDGKMHLLNTTPDSEIANYLIDEAIKVTGETRLYRIGIATHAYADTWAHQNFVGWFDYFNNVGLNFKPDIGHADAEHHPDWPSHRWEDERLVEGTVHNTIRLLGAAKKLYEKYRAAMQNTAPVAEWSALEKKLVDAMGSLFSGSINWFQHKRMDAYWQVAPWIGEFDEAEWRDAAIEKDFLGSFVSGCYTWREDVAPEETNWYRFQEAVKEHQQLAMDRIEPLFRRMGVDLKAH
jgi:hypothetical protein